MSESAEGKGVLCSKEYERNVYIWDNKPEGATHYLAFQYDMIEVYMKLNDGSWEAQDFSGEWSHIENSVSFDGFIEIRDLEDIEKQIEAYELLTDMNVQAV